MSRQQLLARAWILGLVGLTASNTARADVESTFVNTSPTSDVTFSLANTGFQNIRYGVGTLNFSVASSSDPRLTGGYSGFCSEITQSVVQGASQTYSVVPVSSLASVNGSSTKMGLIQDLYNKFYDATSTGVNAGAFQLALWDILHDGEGALGLTTGDFTAQDGPSVAVAENWLSQLSTNPSGPNSYDLIGLANATSQDHIVAFPPDPIPAPPAVVLGLIAVGLVGLRRAMRKSSVTV